MSEFPRAARNARLKCLACNAPVVETIDDEFVCVSCGESPLEYRTVETSPTAE